MKSGCRAEEARLETAERLAKFLALIAVVSWRIFFVTMSARAKPDAAPDSVLTFAEITALNRIDASRTRPRLQRPTLAAYLLQIAMLGGYLARKHDPPPGNMVVWRGMTRLHDIAFGISIGSSRRCGYRKLRRMDTNRLAHPVLLLRSCSLGTAWNRWGHSSVRCQAGNECGRLDANSASPLTHVACTRLMLHRGPRTYLDAEEDRLRFAMQQVMDYHQSAV